MPEATDDNRATLLALVRELYAELHRVAPESVTAGLNSRLDRDLGFDSLARVELLARIEKAFACRMPDAALERAEAPADLLRLLDRAERSGPAPAPRPTTVPEQRPRTTTPPADIDTLPAMLEWHAREHPQRVQIRYLPDGEGPEQAISYGELLREAEAVAAGLQARGLAPGETVAIMLPTCPEYFHSYFGALLAGGVPVPIYPPFRASQIEEHIRRHAAILENAEARLLLVPEQARSVGRLLRASTAGLEFILTPAEVRQAPGARVPVPVRPDDIAFIQYTSGSTGAPKGVVLSHANLLANIRAMGQWGGYSDRDVVVSWLPLYHDMGLIAAWLAGLHFGAELVVMPPPAFLLRPERWLWAIHRYRGSLSAVPNFAFEFCLRRIGDEQIEGLNLSSLRVLANGSERVSADAIERFTQRFAAYGFRPEALVPVYGLAENTVGMAAPPLPRRPRIDRIERETFQAQGIATPAADDDPDPLRFVACGHVLPGHELRAVDAQGRPLPERHEGRLQFRGPSATRGYYRNPEKTRELFDGDWLNSGDRGYLADGEVVLTGRDKDIIIRGGRNFYPEEIEQAVGALDGIRRGCVCAFGSADPQTGTERLVVLAETREQDPQRRTALRETAMLAVRELLGEPPDEIMLAPPQAVLKTSSGKLRRAATRELYEAGTVARGQRAAGWQLLRLGAAALGPALWRLLGDARKWAYGLRVWLVFGLIAPPVWLVTVAARRPAQAWALNHHAGRLLLALAGIGLRVQGRERLTGAAAPVLVANHASYLDGLALIAALPRPCRFVAKAELRESFIARHYLTALGAEFVERFDIQSSVRDSARLVALAGRGEALGFFPEGTFVASPGVLPFHLGAFVTAVKAGAAVVPIAIRGTRRVLRDGRYRPERGRVHMTIGAPLTAAGHETFAAAVDLRNRARDFIVAHSGEPDLAGGR